jgi:secretion/DNA translocation related CpaE-like protein
MPAPTLRDAPGRPLLVTADPILLDEILHLAEQAGAEVSVAGDPAAARESYGTAPLVLLDVALAPSCVRAALPRRPGLVLVGRCAPIPESAWSAAEALGAEHVTALPAAAPWLVRRIADAPSAAPPRAFAVGVVGGRGGAGASVLAGALAVTAAREGARTLLVDADRLGGGVDLVLGWEEVAGPRWSQLTGARQAPARPLPGHGELAVLSWDRDGTVPLAPAAMAAALDAGRATRDLVVVDLPRSLDEAARVAARDADVVLLVVPGGLRAREVARVLDLPLAGSVPPEPGLAKALERGEAPAATGQGALARLCRRLLRDLRIDLRAAA